MVWHRLATRQWKAAVLLCLSQKKEAHYSRNLISIRRPRRGNAGESASVYFEKSNHLRDEKKAEIYEPSAAVEMQMNLRRTVLNGSTPSGRRRNMLMAAEAFIPRGQRKR